jgi:thymidylate kinase
VARRPAGKGRLIVVEGTRGHDVRDAAAALWRRFEAREVHGGVSNWDASGIFSDLRVEKRKHLSLSPRTLVLLYAADLVFRLRWQIRPALDQGQVVIAAPYVDTAVAFGVAGGLPGPWLTKLFAFAPTPDACYRIKEREKASRTKAKPLDGYAEFCAAILADDAAPAGPSELHRRMAAYLEEEEPKNRCPRLTKRVIASEPD